MKLTNAEGRALLNKQKAPAAKWGKTGKPKQTANEITTGAITWLNLNGFFAWRNNNGGVYDPVKKVFRKNKNLLKGVPDIIGYQKGTGRALYIEVKAGKDTIKTDQAQFLADAEKSGAIAGVIRASSEIEEVIRKYLAPTF